jgi:hypothetical protein
VPEPVTTPVAEPTTATEILLLFQVPPGVVDDKVMLAPRQTGPLPVMDAGAGFTVIVAVFVQPVEVSVKVRVVVPPLSAVRLPVDEPTDATVVLLLAHVPDPELFV